MQIVHSMLANPMTHMIYILYKSTSNRDRVHDTLPQILDGVWILRQYQRLLRVQASLRLHSCSSRPLLPYLLYSFTGILHASAESLPSLGLALHLLADLDVDLEELGYAAVEADGLALVQIGFAVRCIDAFRRAGLEETATW
jgi:hypothetical protein